MTPFQGVRPAKLKRRSEVRSSNFAERPLLNFGSAGNSTLIINFGVPAYVKVLYAMSYYFRTLGCSSQFPFSSHHFNSNCLYSSLILGSFEIVMRHLSTWLCLAHNTSLKGTRRPLAVLMFYFYQGSAASLKLSVRRAPYRKVRHT
jgi:hypothetical protein